MDYELLISIEVIEFMERLPRKTRLSLREVLNKIKDHPMHFSDATDYDAVGRLVHISIVGEYALIYWIDDADKHIKILDVHAADR